jgi:hypothetical protein
MTAPKRILARFSYYSALAQLVDAVMHRPGYEPRDRMRAFIFDRLASRSVIEPRKGTKNEPLGITRPKRSARVIASRRSAQLRTVTSKPPNISLAI